METTKHIYHVSHAPLVEAVKDSFRAHWKCNPTLAPSLKRRQADVTDYAGLVVEMMFDDSNPKFDVVFDEDYNDFQQPEDGDSDSSTSKDSTFSQGNASQASEDTNPDEANCQDTDSQMTSEHELPEVTSIDTSNWERSNGVKTMTAESFAMPIRRGMRNQPSITIREEHYPWYVDVGMCLGFFPFNQLWSQYVSPDEPEVKLVSVNLETCVLLLRKLYSEPFPENKAGVQLVWESARDLLYSANAVLDTLAAADLCTNVGDGKLFRTWISTESVDPLDLLETGKMNAAFKGTRLAEHIVTLLFGLYDQMLAVSYLATVMRNKAKDILDAFPSEATESAEAQ